MLSLIKLILKVSIIGGIAIFLGHFVKIDGMTLNDRMGLFAEKSKQATITRDIQRWAHQIKQPLNSVAPAKTSDDEIDEVDTAEQERLKALLKKKTGRSR